MALTDTKASKTFVAGAPDIILKGDYRRDKPEMKMASDPDIMDERNELSLRLFGKELKLLTPEEMDILDQEAERLMQKFMADGGRAQYGLGSIVKGVKKAVKGVGKGIKSLISSDAGKLALLNFAPMLIPGGASTFFGGSNALFNMGNILGLKKGSDAMNALKIGGAGAVITGLLAQKEELDTGEPDDSKRRAEVIEQLKVQFSRLYPKADNESPEEYDLRINAMVENADDQTIDVGNMAEGGRVGLASGANDRYEAKIKELMDKGLSRELAEAIVLSDLSPEAFTIPEKKAEGGRIGRAFGSDKLVEQASGIEGLPINMNSKGVKELDMRETGGFIPPVGVKEKADDIPAMLSNNEFVFTADAVRAAGGGSVNKGAQRMYDLMKNLESKVV